MSNNINKILTNTTKRVTEARNPLARMWRQILLDLNVTPMAFDKMINRYLDDPRNHIPKDPKKRSTERGNMMKELSKPSITWKTLEKGLRLFPFTELTIELHFKWGSGRTTIHGLTMQNFQQSNDGNNYNFDIVSEEREQQEKDSD